MASIAASKQNVEIVRRFVEELINDAQYERAEEFLAEDVRDSTPLGESSGRDAVVETTKVLRAAFPDVVVTPKEIVADGDTVAIWMTQHGTHEGAFMGIEPTGKSFDIEAMAFLRLEDGKIVERRSRPDLVGLLRQLGISELPAA